MRTLLREATKKFLFFSGPATKRGLMEAARKVLFFSGPATKRGLREAARKVLFLVARPLRGGGDL